MRQDQTLWWGGSQPLRVRAALAGAGVSHAEAARCLRLSPAALSSRLRLDRACRAWQPLELAAVADLTGVASAWLAMADGCPDPCCCGQAAAPRLATVGGAA